MAAHGVTLDYLTPLRNRMMDTQKRPLLSDLDYAHDDHNSTTEPVLNDAENHAAQQPSSTIRDRRNLHLLLRAGPALLLRYCKVSNSAESLY